MTAPSSFTRRVNLPHSEHQPVPQAEQVGKAAGDRQIRVSVILKRKAPLDLEGLHGRQISRDEYAEKYSASKGASDAVMAYAKSHGLTVDEGASSLVRRRVELKGTVSAFNQAFGVDLHDYEPHLPAKSKLKAGRFHAFTGMVTVPEELLDSVQAVLGLDNRPIATPKFRFRPNAAADAGTFTPPQVAQVYSFPAPPSGTLAGAGQTIGIIELGGGFTTTDIKNYFTQLGVAVPKVTAVLLDGGTNAPGDPSGADGEVMLDIEVAGGVAPGANIVVYFTTNTDQGFQDAISTAIHDTTNNPSVISISWGGPESSWSQTAINSMDTTCQSAAALGVTITVASGDNGSSDGGTGDNVDFPASSPNVLACGGTALTASNGKRQGEVVWNDQSGGGGATGGGFSTVFPVPSYQTGVITSAKKPTHKKHKAAADGTSSNPAAKAASGRGVPDVAGDASPETGFQVLVDGQQEVVGGTSAVAPLWAGLVALLNQQLGRKVGFLNPQLYPLKEAPFFDVTSGNNGDFSAATGWDPCTGLGAPNGQALLAALQKSSTAS
jgi:kumamolisin